MTSNFSIPLSEIIVEDRLRKDYGDSGDLDTISTIGLIQPLVLQLDHTTDEADPNGETNRFRLIAGGRRFAWLIANDYTELFHGTTSDPLRPGFVFVNELPPEQQLEIEVIENMGRKDLDWREMISGVSRIHQAWKNRAALAGEKWTQSQTGERLGGYDGSYVSYCLELVPCLANPAFNDCSSLVDAIKLRAQLRIDEAVKEQTRRTMALAKTPVVQPVPVSSWMPCIACGGTGKATNGSECPICAGDGQTLEYEPVAYLENPPTIIDLTHTIIHDNSLAWLEAVQPGVIDHIISDPPYGIDVAMMEQATKGIVGVNRIEDTHDVEENLKLFDVMFPLFFRVLKPTGFCILWCDCMNWQLLYDKATDAGFSVQRWPHVWVKTSQCLNQMAYHNETKATEFVIICRMPEARIGQPIAKNWTMADGLANKLSNPFAKPFDVWKPLIENFTYPGELILDPFSGEGTCPLAALRLDRKTIGIELDETHFSFMVQAFKQFNEQKYGKVEFV